MTQLPTNPFNSGSPVDPNDFIGRTQEIENFKQKLRQTAEGSLASMAVAGGYGIGKTSFLHKCKVIAEEDNALVIYFSLNELDESNRESLSKILIERLREKVREEVILQRISSNIIQTLKKIKVNIASSIEVSLSENNEASTNLQGALLIAWKALKPYKKAIVFLIDEARVLEKHRADLILYLRAVLEQLQINKVPIMIVPAGKLTISGPSGTGFSPLVRTFPPAILENFTKEECNIFIKKKLDKIGFSINDNLLEKVYNITEGHPFVLSAYMATAYSKIKAGETELKEEHFKATDIDFVKHILSHFFSRFYDQAGRSSKNILIEISKKGGEITIGELSEILHKEYSELSPHLGKLVQDGAIIRIDRGRYKLFHKLLGRYITN